MAEGFYFQTLQEGSAAQVAFSIHTFFRTHLIRGTQVRALAHQPVGLSHLAQPPSCQTQPGLIVGSTVKTGIRAFFV